jgi:hypothetical protein
MNLSAHSALLLLALAATACQQHSVPAMAPAAIVASAMPAAPAAHAAAAPGAFDASRIPVTRAAQPPFPYLDLPEALRPMGGKASRVDADRVLVVAGKELIRIQGRVERRHFSLSGARMSQAAVARNYAAALKEMGAVQVNQVQPSDPAFLAAHGGPTLKGYNEREKLDLLNGDADYRSYLIRTPTKNIWIVVAIDQRNVSTVSIEETADEHA